MESSEYYSSNYFNRNEVFFHNVFIYHYSHIESKDSLLDAIKKLIDPLLRISKRIRFCHHVESKANFQDIKENVEKTVKSAARRLNKVSYDHIL